ncbi:MAG TPA: hypothetical protein VET88_01865 [Gammaproteobacteria bacterium]|nr:hypothetical protein [Gammaproteobacteria bacterium]
MSAYDAYIRSLNRHFWDYVESDPDLFAGLLDTGESTDRRPPVFKAPFADRNILIPHGATPEDCLSIEDTLPKQERHRFFGSMRSSQALAQSVFGNLIALGKMDVLSDLESDEGLPAFFYDLGEATVKLEHAVEHLDEPRPTSIDLWVEGSKRVAVECKLSEPDFGTCSRPRLKPHRDNNYERNYCDGTYASQRGRVSRCSLTETGVQYWTYAPEILSWDSTTDMNPCPLRETYQLIRNILAACVTTDGQIEMEKAHALTIYDARNPSFQHGGTANRQWHTAKSALRNNGNLRSCSWQRLLLHIYRDPDLHWLVGALNAKYALDQ